MPRRSGRIAQGDIARVIRAAREAGAAEVIVDGERKIRVVLTNCGGGFDVVIREDDQSPTWTMYTPTRKERWSSRDATSWRDISKYLLRP